MPLEGQQLGRYRLLSLIGSGGMGKVYLAEDTLIDRQVAIKVIRAETSSHPDSTPVQQAMRLFQREAKAIAKLNHPHILPLFDFGEEHIDGTTLTYMVMPFCQDGSFALYLYVDNKLVDAQLLTKGSDPAIHTGLNQQNTIAVVANAIGMDLYVNRKLILNGSVKESTYSHGQIAVAADAEPMPTEVVFSNARVWTL